MPIRFFSERIDFQLKNQDQIINWFNLITKSHRQHILELNYIFCSDDYLLKINRDYLKSDYYTDIITFNNAEKEGMIEGDIFISIERITDNAQFLQISFANELHRVLIHGLLHLLGFNDKTPHEQALMRKKENLCLSLLKYKFHVKH